ncbi:MAG: D-glycerate dehydrogenase, partial [Anaerolineales bacterium]|nr:D-glycerate dehydrogenase [Anaerolineales bacterium]
MKPKVFVTRIIPRSGIDLLEQYCQVKVSVQDRVIAKDELLDGVKWCDALLCLLTDRIDEEVIAANPNLKVIANYAVGYDNIDLKAATAA